MNNNRTQRKVALIAGFSLIIMALVAGFAYGYAFQKIYVPNNGELTLVNLNQSPLLLRWLIFSFVLILLLDILVSWALYIFFQQVNQNLALLASWIRLVYAALLGIALLSLVVVVQLSDGATPNAELIMRCLKTFLDMWSLGLIVFGCHLLLLGYLVFSAAYIPKFIGILTMFAAVAYVASNAANLLIINYEQYKTLVDTLLTLPMALGELALAFWLVWRGGKTL